MGPDKLETGESQLLHFKEKLDFINLFLWALHSCVGTTEDQIRDKLYAQKEGGKRLSEDGQGCADSERGLMLV